MLAMNVQPLGDEGPHGDFSLDPKGLWAYDPCHKSSILVVVFFYQQDDNSYPPSSDH